MLQLEASFAVVAIADVAGVEIFVTTASVTAVVTVVELLEIS